MELSSSFAKNVLVLGSGGREHALAWKLSQSPHIRYVYVAPGNAGTLTCNRLKVKNVPLLKNDVLDEIVTFAKENEIALVVPGPETCLVAGISDKLREAGIPCFGPSKMASQLEGSKAFSKAFMKRHGIPTPSFQVFTDYTDALNYVGSVTHPIVIKASGLAAGKGVLLPKTNEEAAQVLHMLMVEKVFGDAANEVVIEERLDGEELSVLAFSDGYTVAPFPSARDYKRIYDNDQGPNTGGMGAYAPAAPTYLVSTIQKQVLQPTIDGIRKEGHPFIGVLYAGIMLTKQGPKVLEYNVRMGDPETQALLPLLKSDLFEIFLACCEGYLDAKKLEFHPGFACAIVLASKGYPGKYTKDITIQLSNDPTSDVSFFHSGTAMHEQLVTSGGRVLCVTGLGPTLEVARDNAYQVIEKKVTFGGMQYRKDIAYNYSKASATYADAGVSIDQGDLLVERIRPFAKATQRPGADADLGGFGGLFDLSRAGFKPTDVLVAATDGVGTKLKLALEMNKHDTIGIDLVAMNVNDIVVQAAEPLLFLDYFACGKLNVGVATSVIQGIAEGCKQAGCALVGGETAEMPSMYQDQDYDLAGFSVGAVTPANVLPKPHLMQSGDLVLGLVSSGIHSNGFSLVRHLTQNLNLHSPCPFAPEQSLGDALLTPTRIYVRPLLKVSHLLKGMAHITGGGLVDNIPRILPESLGVVLDARNWPTLPVFTFLRQLGNIEKDEMLRTFNCGLGMVVVASPENLNALKEIIPEFLVVGKVVPRSCGHPQVFIENF